MSSYRSFQLYYTPILCVCQVYFQLSQLFFLVSNKFSLYNRLIKFKRSAFL
nr:MAG TPA: hypothetical protein [Caudoviricetes sp.]